MEQSQLVVVSAVALSLIVLHRRFRALEATLADRTAALDAARQRKTHTPVLSPSSTCVGVEQIHEALEVHAEATTRAAAGGAGAGAGEGGGSDTCNADIASLRLLLAPSPAPARQRREESLEIGIFWDYENVRVPCRLDVCDAWSCIRDSVHRAAREISAAQPAFIAERRLYFDSRSPHETNTDRVKLDLSGFTLVDCPKRNTKETLDKKIIVDLMHFALERRARRAPCCVVLISSDADYSYMLSRLRDLGTSVVVIHDTNTSDVLLSSAHVTLHWTGDVLTDSNQPLLPQTFTDISGCPALRATAARPVEPPALRPSNNTKGSEMDKFVTLLCKWIESKGVQRVSAIEMCEFYKANPSVDKSILPSKKKLEHICSHNDGRGRLRWSPDANSRSGGGSGGWLELVSSGPVHLGDLRGPVARLGSMQTAGARPFLDYAVLASPGGIGPTSTQPSPGEFASTNLSIGYLSAFLICLRKQQQVQGESSTADQSDLTRYPVMDSILASQYYKVKGFKDQDRYKSVKESARVGGYIKIDYGESSVKLWLTALGASTIKHFSDSDATTAD